MARGPPSTPLVLAEHLDFSLRVGGMDIFGGASPVARTCRVQVFAEIRVVQPRLAPLEPAPRVGKEIVSRVIVRQLG